MPSSGDYPATEPAPRCEEHGGEHATWLGRCIAVGAQVPRPFAFSPRSWDCEECGARVYGVTMPGGRRFLMDERDGEVHHCPPKLRVELDEGVLASALANAFDSLRRQRERPAVREPEPEGPPPQPAEHRPATPVRSGSLGGIPRLGT